MSKICVSCKSIELDELELFSSLPRVSSDGKPFKKNGKIGICKKCGLVQKIIDRKFIKEITEIYSGYEMYSENVSDQPLFLNGTYSTRSKILIEELTKLFNLPCKGKLLDIGAGKGAFLNEFSKYFPDWELNSLEYDNKYNQYLAKINKFKKNYINIDDIEKNKFDLIVSIHTVEHLLDPIVYLKKIKQLLKNSGLLFFQVPDCSNSPFDIAIADHVLHFSRHTFKELLTRAGLESQIQVIITKEITAFCGLNIVKSEKINDDFDILQNINYLHRVGSLIKHYPINYTVGIYGTTIAANWLSSQMREIDFYVDDDEAKVGKLFLGKRIFSAKDIPMQSHVFLPFSPSNNAAIIQRLSTIRQSKDITLIPIS